MLTNQYGFSPNAKTVTQVVANLGAIAGGKDEMAQVFSRQLIMSQVPRLVTVCNIENILSRGDSLTV